MNGKKRILTTLKKVTGRKPDLRRRLTLLERLPKLTTVQWFRLIAFIIAAIIAIFVEAEAARQFLELILGSQ